MHIHVHNSYHFIVVKVDFFKRLYSDDTQEKVKNSSATPSSTLGCHSQRVSDCQKAAVSTMLLL